MAEDVGDIYVDAHVDTKSLDREMKTAANLAGRDFGTYFTKSLGSELDTTMTQVGAKIRHTMASNGKLSAIDFSQNMKDLIQKEFKNFDLDLSHAVVFGDWGRVLDRFDEVEDGATRVRKRLRELNETTGLTDYEFDKAIDSMAKWVSTAKVASAESASLARTQKSLRLELERQQQIEKESAGSSSSRVKNAKSLETSLGRVARATRSANDEEGKSFSLLGRLTGSRNDFLNIVGKTARMLENLPRLFTRVGGGIQTFTSGIAKATEGLTGFQRVAAGVRAGMTGITKGLQGLVKTGGKGGPLTLAVTLGILAAALLSLGNIVTGVAGGLSAFTGILTAFASSLTAALGGALLSVGPMLGAFAVGLGAVTTAIIANKDAFKEAIAPLSEWATEAGKIAGAAMLPSITDAANTLAGVLRTQLTPMLKESAGVIGDWAKAFADSLNSSEMKQNMSVFSDTWPGILENLGSIFTSVFEGISGVLAAISPGVERFTGAIADAAEKFSDWANSASGQNTIRDFFEGAWESAKKLWGILSNVATAIGNVFSQGKDTGDSFLDSLEDITDQFAKWTDSDEGRAAISQWFEDAKDLASTLGDLIGNIAEKFDEWDTERNRQDFEDILDAVSGIVGGIMDVITGLNAAADWLADMDAKANDFIESLTKPIGDWFGGQFDEIGDIWNGLTEGLSTAWTSVQTWWSGTFLPWLSSLHAQAGGFFTGLWDGLTTGLGEAWAGVQAWFSGTFLPFLAGLPAQVGQFVLGIVDWFVQLPFRIVDALVNLPFQVASVFSTAFNALQPIITTAISNIVSWVGALPGRIVGALTTLGATLAAWARQAWNTAYTAVVTTATRIVTWVGGLPARIVSAAARLPSLLGSWATSAWNRALTAMTNVVNRILSFVRGLPARVISAVTRLGSMLGSWATDAWNRAYTAISNVVNRILSFVREIPQRIISALGNLGSRIGSFFRDAFQRGYEGMSDRGQAIVRWVAGLPGRIIGALGNVGNLLYSVGTSIVDGLYRGLTSAWSRVTGWASNAASGLSSAVRRVLGISSPSKVFMEIGRNTTDGLALGLESRLPALERSAARMGQSMVRFAGVSAPSLGTGSMRISAGGLTTTSGQSKATTVAGAGGRSVTVAAGAIQVHTNVADPRLVASQVLDRMATKVV